MGDDNVIPLNDELLTVAKISDLDSIANNYILTDIAAVIEINNEDLNSMLDRDTNRLKNLLCILPFFSDTALVSDEFKENANRALDILNQHKSGLVLTDSNIAVLKSSLSVIYAELVEFGKTNISLLKSIVFSCVDSELEKALYKISTYPYAHIARLNSLIYKNVNSLMFISRMIDKIVFLVNADISRLEVMIDMCKVTKAHSRTSLGNLVSTLYDSVRTTVKQIIDNKFIVTTGNEDHRIDWLSVNNTDLEVLNAINEYREKIKATYSTIRLDKLSIAFNFDLNDMHTEEPCSLFTEADFKETLFKIKCNIDILTELVCNITDSINTSVEKLNKSIPVSENEIDNIDAI